MKNGRKLYFIHYNGKGDTCIVSHIKT